MKSTFQINDLNGDFHLYSTFEKKKDRLIVSSSIKLEGRSVKKIEANFSLSFIQERFGTGLNKMGFWKDSKAQHIILFPISDDCEWKTIIYPDIQEDFFKFLGIKTHRK